MKYIITILSLVLFIPIVYAEAPITLIDTLNSSKNTPPTAVNQDIVETPLLPLTHEEKALKLVKSYAEIYHVDEQSMMETLRCESHFNPDDFNKEDPYGGAKGIAQFLEPTFQRYVKKVDIENPDIWNPEHQIHVMAYMFSINQQHQWTCYRNIYGKIKK